MLTIKEFKQKTNKFRPCRTTVIKINIDYNKGFKWSDNGSVFFKGFIVHQEKYLKGEEVLKLFSGFSGFSEIKNTLKSVEGLFSLIIRNDDSLLFAVDRFRTFPLFYQIDDGITITDNPYSFPSKTIDKNLVNEFLLTGYTTGRNILIKDTYQTKPAEISIYHRNIIESEQYYTHKTKEVLTEPIEVLTKQLEEILYTCFKDFIRTLENRPVALSISGGYDSRLIALMLKYFGYKQVFCFTYGRKENEELDNSMNTAKKLGYPWYFIEYSQKIANNYLYTNLFKEYVKFAGKLSSMPYLQDYFAVKHIKDNNLVDKNTIFISGHSGDSIAGSHLKGRFKNNDSPSKAIKQIFYSNFNISPLYNKDQIFKKFQDEIESDDFFAYSIYENWILQERQAKFIVNSASVYDYFGHEHRMPLLDGRFLSFFKKVPLKYKNHKILYNNLLQQMFSQFNLNFENELQASNTEIFLQNIKNRIKHIVPTGIIKKYRKAPWHAYDILTAPMVEDLKGSDYERSTGIDYNSVICNWYIKNVLASENNE
jgi:asparagine synthase (glutamine-hydrolysing)